MNKKYKTLSVVTFFILLTGCSNNKWSCPLPETGKSCRSISEVDNSKDSGANTNKKKNRKAKISKNILSEVIGGVALDDLNPVRTKEEIGRILITPYIDKEGNLNSGKFIYTIDEKPKWKIR